MTVSTNGFRFDPEHEPVASLVRVVPVRVVEISRGGCRFESATRLEPGQSGRLTFGLLGVARLDDIRVARCQQRAGGSAVYHVGVELLGTRRLGRRSVRLAVRSIIGAHTGGEGRTLGRVPEPATLGRSSGEAGLRSAGRPPPREGAE